MLQQVSRGQLDLVGVGGRGHCNSSCWKIVPKAGTRELGQEKTKRRDRKKTKGIIQLIVQIKAVRQAMESHDL